MTRSYLTDYNLAIDIKELKKQINAVLKSNMPEKYKVGVHNLLGEILDQAMDNED